MGFGSVGDTKVHAGPVSVAEHAFPSPILFSEEKYGRLWSCEVSALAGNP